MYFLDFINRISLFLKGTRDRAALMSAFPLNRAGEVGEVVCKRLEEEEEEQLSKSSFQES